ncbi:MAG: lamin tail domain-containing protein, partial [Planctomycetes bacterium]|nr:lamin tail domain-containing protein [Planctomycetota bacterium]
MQQSRWSRIRGGLLAGGARLDRCISHLLHRFGAPAVTASTRRQRRRTGIATPEALEPRLVLDSTVVFNEIMYHPDTSEDTREWIELHNQMAVDMDLSGWRLSGGVNFDFADGTVLLGGGYLVIAASPEDFIAETGLPESVVLGPLQGRLNNAGETLRLRNNNDRIMD